jgi:glycerophosphoryl diester phosphodiesterase
MKTVIFISFTVLIISACQKKEFNIENLNGNKITALGHAGLGIGSPYPMNSLESLLKCLNLGSDGTELDVQMTKDSVLVAYHNNELSSNTNLTGIINSLNWNDIKHGHYTSTPYLNYSIISVDQLFSNVENVQQYKFTFDCKLYTNSNNTDQFHEAYINALIAIIEKYQLENNVYIEAQNVDFLKSFKDKRPDYKLFIYPSSFQSGFDIATSLGLYGITISTREITKEQIQLAHANNLFVAIWNTHSISDNIEAIKKNPDFIQTDNVKNLVKLLK